MGKMATRAHTGFKVAEASIQRREGISKDRAGAILASAARHASAGAKRSNPRLRRVSGA